MRIRLYTLVLFIFCIENRLSAEHLNAELSDPASASIDITYDGMRYVHWTAQASYGPASSGIGGFGYAAAAPVSGNNVRPVTSQANYVTANYGNPGNPPLTGSAEVQPGQWIYIIAEAHHNGGSWGETTVDNTVEKWFQIPADTGNNGKRLVKEGDPVEVATGFEVITRTLFRFRGARSWDFTLSYNSGFARGYPTLTGQDVPRGWSHNYSATLGNDGNGNILVGENRLARFVFIPDLLNPGTFYGATDGCQNDVIRLQSDGTWLLTHQDQSAQLFSGPGLLLEDRDKHGVKLVLGYTNGQISSITEPISATSLALTRDVNGFIQTLSDASGATAQLESSNGLTKITDQAGHGISYAYDDQFQLLTAADDAGLVFISNTYNADGRVVLQSDGIAGHQVAQFTYAYVGGGLPLVTTYTDHSGVTKTYWFDKYYNKGRIYDALNRLTSCEYDSSNRLTQIAEPGKGLSIYTYNPKGEVLTFTDPVGAVTTYTYDANGNVLTVTDPDNKVTINTYDAKNNCLSTTDPLGQTSSWTYDVNSCPLTNTLPRGGVYSYSYTVGRITQAIDPSGVITAYTYDANGKILTIGDATAHHVSYSYDPLGYVATITNALGQTSSFTYTLHGDLATFTDATGLVVSYTYDAARNLHSIDEGLGNVTTFTYDNANRLASSTDALNRTTTYSRDVLGNITSIVAPDGSQRIAEYDEQSRPTSVVDAMGRRVQINYDPRGMIQYLDDHQNPIVNTYDVIGRLTKEEKSINHITHFSYDAISQLKQVIDADGNVTTQNFDPDGNLSSVTGPNGKSIAFTHDAEGRLVNESTPAGRATLYEYDARGWISKLTAPSGLQSTFVHDAAGRLTGVSDSLGTVSLAYNGSGRMTSIAEGNKTITRAYDAVGHLVSYTNDQGDTIGYEYNVAGELTKLIYPDGKQVRYAYNAAGFLSTVTDWNNRVTSYSYNLAGQLTQLIRANGTKQTYLYNARGLLEKITDYGVDGITKIYGGDFTYNTAALLESATVNPGFAPQPTNFTQSYDDDNRIVTHNGASATYDADGNLLSVASGVSPSTYTFDSRNRLLMAGGLNSAYDSENRRTALGSGLSTTHFVVNPNASLDQVLVRTDPTGVKTFYVYGIGLLLEETNSSVRYYHHDRRGDTIALTDAAGVVTDRAAYGPHGELWVRSGTTNTPFLFNGYFGVQTDPNGLYYCRSRFYSPTLRRFINQDVFLGNVSEGSSLNRYAYSNSDPINGVDPLGLWKVEIGFAWGIGAKVSFGYNGGRWSLDGVGGVGVGWTAGINPNDSGSNNMVATSVKVGIRGDGSLNLGMLGASGGFGWTTESDFCENYNYENKLYIKGSLSFRGVEKGYPGFGKIGGEVGLRQSGNIANPDPDFHVYTKSEGLSYSIGALGIIGLTAGVAWK